MKFAVSGEIILGRETRKFVKEVEASSERAAKDTAMKLLGSAHGKKRTKISIKSVEKVDG